MQKLEVLFLQIYWLIMNLNIIIVVRLVLNNSYYMQKKSLTSLV